MAEKNHTQINSLSGKRKAENDGNSPLPPAKARASSENLTNRSREQAQNVSAVYPFQSKSQKSGANSGNRVARQGSRSSAATVVTSPYFRSKSQTSGANRGNHSAGQQRSSTSSSTTRSTLTLNPGKEIGTDTPLGKLSITTICGTGTMTMGPTWHAALQNQFQLEYFRELMLFLEQEAKKYVIYPPEGEVYGFTKHCAIHQIKVVIIGQDPYHKPEQATGLAFSVPSGVKIPPSLANIYVALKNNIDGFENPGHGNLTGWARQGVLLLNATLTVREGKANSHKNKGWERFTDIIIRWINDNLHNVVFLLWGKYAQKKGSFINKEKHLVLESAHPSPACASKEFSKCEHFSITNDYLQKTNQTPIDWCNLPIE